MSATYGCQGILCARQIGGTFEQFECNYYFHVQLLQAMLYSGVCVCAYACACAGACVCTCTWGNRGRGRGERVCLHAATCASAGVCRQWPSATLHRQRGHLISHDSIGGSLASTIPDTGAELQVQACWYLVRDNGRSWRQLDSAVCCLQISGGVHAEVWGHAGVL